MPNTGAGSFRGDPDALVVAETGEPPAPRARRVTPRGRPRRVTLDGQLLGYWAREAARLEALAAAARFAWQRHRYLRKAEAARARRSRAGSARPPGTTAARRRLSRG
ncbi:hypothetical protein ACU4GR_20660 [Methylobacterium oryzae CBMB20]